MSTKEIEMSVDPPNLAGYDILSITLNLISEHSPLKISRLDTSTLLQLRSHDREGGGEQLR